MNRNGIVRIGWMILMVALAACATSTSEMNKKQAEATRRVGEAHLQQGNFAAAMREFKKAEAKNADDYLLQFDLGLLYSRKEKYDEAIVHFKKALELNPKYGAAINSLGNAYGGKGDWDQAIVYYKKAIGDLLYGTPHFAYANLGNAYYYKGDLRQSEKNYLEALSIKPKFINALQGLSRTYVAMGRMPEAVEQLEKAVRLSPKAADLHFQLAEAYKLSLDFQKAYRSYQQVIRLAPDTPLAEQAKEGAREVKALF
jgi:type IV pilus assembly protein PilF